MGTNREIFVRGEMSSDLCALVAVFPHAERKSYMDGVLEENGLYVGFTMVVNE